MGQHGSLIGLAGVCMGVDAPMQDAVEWLDGVDQLRDRSVDGVSMELKVKGTTQTYDGDEERILMVGTEFVMPRGSERGVHDALRRRFTLLCVSMNGVMQGCRPLVSFQDMGLIMERLRGDEGEGMVRMRLQGAVVLRAQAEIVDMGAELTIQAWLWDDRLKVPCCGSSWAANVTDVWRQADLFIVLG
jgi:hypothetical protein